MLRNTRALCLTLGVLAASSFLAPNRAAAQTFDEDKAEQMGASLCKAVRSMKYQPILASYFQQGNTLTMKVNWFGELSGKKYTSNITIVFEQGSSKIADVKYSDNGPWAHEPAFVEKWRRDANKKTR